MAPGPSNRATPEQDDSRTPPSGQLGVEPGGPDTHPAATSAPSAEQPGGGKVAVKLAHPVDDKETMRRLRLDPDSGGYKIGDQVHLLPDDARALINAGYAQVDPEDNEAVRSVLRPNRSA